MTIRKQNSFPEDVEESKYSSQGCPACHSIEFNFKNVNEKMRGIVKNLVETHSCEIFFNSSENPENDPLTDKG
jgi:hypothetical protein